MADNSTRSVDRALDLLAYVCSQDAIDHGATLADCAKKTVLSPSTALRLLRSLEARGFIERDEAGQFHPGTQIMQIGANVMSRKNLIRLARPGMKHIVEQVNESVYLTVRNYDGDILYIAVEECSRSIRHASWLGKTIPAEEAASGKVLGEATPASELATIIPDGYATEAGSIEPDVTAIAAPIIATDNTVAAISILAPSYRMPAERIRSCGRLLAQHAAKISTRLSSEQSPT